jgi:hypothetical protein
VKADSANRDRHERKFADARLRYQFFLFLFCLLASISFWLLIKMSNEYTLSFTIPIKIANVSKDRILTGISDSTIEISLKAQGYKLIVLRYFDHPKPLFIDISNSKKSDNIDEINTDLQLMPLVRRYSGSIGFINEIRAVHPEQLTVKTNRLYSKTVPVRLTTDISFAPQYLQFEPSLIKPSSITVYGTHAMIDSVQVAQPEVIKIRNMTESMVTYVHLNKNTQINKPYFNPSTVQVTIPIQKFTEESVEVIIKLINPLPGKNIKLFPDNAVVSCIVSMKDYKKLDSRLFTVNAELSNSDNLYHLTVTTAPDYVRNVKVTPEKVEYLVLR